MATGSEQPVKTAILDRVLTRWCNLHLPQDSAISELSGLQDEDKLVSLVEKLSGKKVVEPRSAGHRKLSFSKKWMVVDTALDFMRREEQIKIEGELQSKGVAKGEMGSMRVLVWSMALHYLVNPTISSLPFPPSQSLGDHTPTTDKLISFISSKLPSNLKDQLKDLTTSWSDGSLLTALVDALFPVTEEDEEEEEVEEVKKEEEKEKGGGGRRRKRLGSVADVLRHTQALLGTPEVLLPEEFSSPDIDEKSMMIFFSYLLATSSEVLTYSIESAIADMPVVERVHRGSCPPNNSLFVTLRGPNAESRMTTEHLKRVVDIFKRKWSFIDFNVAITATNSPSFPMLYSEGGTTALIGAEVWLEVLTTDPYTKDRLMAALQDIKNDVVKEVFSEPGVKCVTTLHQMTHTEINCISLNDT